MKIRSDLLKVSSGALNLKGERVEPEEQLARREVIIDSEVKLGSGTLGQTVGSIPASIVTDTTAGQMARSLQTMCGNCKHFRNDLFLKDLKQAMSPGAPIARQRAVNQIRAALLQTQNAQVADMAAGPDGDIDVETALRQLGYCKALYEFFRNAGQSNEDAMTLVHPMSTCPEDTRTAASPDGFFQFADRGAKEIAGKAYDSIMQRAAGVK